MTKKIINPVLRLEAQKIIESNYKFEKGQVSDFSIEVYEPETDSFTSYIYYSDEKSRDKDFEILCKLK